MGVSQHSHIHECRVLFHSTKLQYTASFDLTIPFYRDRRDAV